MSDTVVSLLTPPGTGAIATIEVRGPRAWELARHLFKPVGNRLPESPEVNRFCFGTLGSDEVVFAVTGADTIEVHCHGGCRVVRWLIEQFLAHGCIESRTPRPSGEGFGLLQRAPTLRTASIILDQLNGAFASEARRILAHLETDPVEARNPLYRLAELGNTIGRHLVEPWKVGVVGPPNVGKSSLVNALAGYQRSVVSELAGTTRDAVSVRTAFDGWPVELIDTAGIRVAEGLEADGVERAKEESEGADLVLWIMDASASDLALPTDTNAGVGIARSTRCVWVMNKSDCAIWSPGFPVAATRVSAHTLEGIPLLTARIVNRLVPHPPAPGAAIPVTPRLARLVDAARAALYFERPIEAAHFLREALAEAE